MPTDPNIALGATGGAQTVNPLQMLSGMMDIQNKSNQNALFGSEFAARKAIGPILQGAINPESGEIDVNAALKGLSESPAAAFKAPEIMNSLLDAQQKKIEIATKQTTLAKEQVGILNTALGSLAAYGDNVTRDHVLEVAGTITGQMNDPQFTKKMAITLASLPPGGPALAQRILQLQEQSAGSEKQLDATLGQLQQLDLGNRTRMLQVSKQPNTAPRQLGGDMAKGLEPSAAAEGVNYLNPDTRQTETISKGEFAEKRGLAPGGTYTGKVGVTPEQIRNATIVPGGTQGPAALAPPPAAETTAIAPPASPVAPMITKLSPEEAKAREDLGTGLASYKNDLDARIKSAQPAVLRINELQTLLPNIRTGAGSEIWLKAGEIAQALGASNAQADRIYGGNLAGAQEAKKFFVQNSTELLRTMLVGSRMTNLEFEQFLHNNPELTTDPRATEKIFNFVKQLYNIDSIEQRSLAKYLKTPGADITAWPSFWNEQVRKLGFLNSDLTKQAYSKSAILRGSK